MSWSRAEPGWSALHAGSAVGRAPSASPRAESRQRGAGFRRHATGRRDGRECHRPAGGGRRTVRDGGGSALRRGGVDAGTPGARGAGHQSARCRTRGRRGGQQRDAVHHLHRQCHSAFRARDAVRRRHRKAPTPGPRPTANASSAPCRTAVRQSASCTRPALWARTTPDCPRGITGSEPCSPS